MSAVVIVAAHPDDEVLGCGGTIAMLSEVHEVHILLLGEGGTSRFASREDANGRTVERLATAAKSAAAILGAQSVETDRLPDNRFDQVALLDIVKRIERIIERVRPDIVYTHHPGDLNIDHRITFEAVLTATRPLPGRCVHELYTFEIASSTEWAFQRIKPSFVPNVFVDISRTLERKLKAMEQYEDEMRMFPHPRSAEGLRTIARRSGTVVGREYVEAFEMVRSIR